MCSKQIVLVDDNECKEDCTILTFGSKCFQAIEHLNFKHHGVNKGNICKVSNKSSQSTSMYDFCKTYLCMDSKNWSILFDTNTIILDQTLVDGVDYTIQTYQKCSFSKLNIQCCDWITISNKHSSFKRNVFDVKNQRTKIYYVHSIFKFDFDININNNIYFIIEETIIHELIEGVVPIISKSNKFSIININNIKHDYNVSLARVVHHCAASDTNCCFNNADQLCCCEINIHIHTHRLNKLFIYNPFDFIYNQQI